MHFYFFCVVVALAVSSSTAIPEPCTIPAVEHGEVGNYVTRKYTKNRSRECFYQLQAGESVDNEDPVILRCEKGYLPAGSPQTSKVLRFKEDVVTCEDGSWSKPLLCEAEITCGEPPSIQFATVTSLFPDDYPLGTIVAYECEPGYVIRGYSTTSKCIMSDNESQAVWTKARMSCSANISLMYVPATKIPGSTPEPEKRQQEEECSCTYNYESSNTLAYVGGEKLLRGSKVKKGSLVIFTCQHQEMIFTLPTGLHVTGSVNMTCDKCQEWQEGDVPACVSRNQISCDKEPPPIKNGHPLIRKRTHGHVIYYQCDDFSVKVKAGRVECVYGIWRGDPPVCLDTRCYTEQLNFPGLENPDEEFLTDRESFSISCEEGFEVSDLQTKISCEMGQWRIIDNPCIKVPSRDSRCSEIDGKNKFIVSYFNERKINSVAHYRCKSNSQKILGTNTRTCQQNGEWSGSNPVCVDITCPELKVSGVLTVAFSKENKLGSRAEFRCRPPAVLVGSSTARCQANGDWSNPQPSCVESEVRCPAINERGIFTVRYNNDRKVNSFAYYFCNEENQKISGSMFRTCQENGEWSGIDPKCEDPGCPVEVLLSLLPADVIPYHEDVTEELFPSGSDLRLLCENNMALIGNKKVRCNKQGRWNLENVHCVSGCVADHNNSPSALIIEPVKDFYNFGEFAILSCPDEFELTTEVERVMCMGSGWSDPLPNCKKIIH